MLMCQLQKIRGTHTFIVFVDNEELSLFFVISPFSSSSLLISSEEHSPENPTPNNINRTNISNVPTSEVPETTNTNINAVSTIPQLI
jgi:hypothetical protein